MTGTHGDDGRVCLCNRSDGTCAGIAIRRLSLERVRELAEEIWTASSGDLPPPRPAPDPRSCGAWTGWRLRFRPSAEARMWRRQAAMQRRAAAALASLNEEGRLVLHDVVLPGWLGSLDHLVVGRTGV